MGSDILNYYFYILIQLFVLKNIKEISLKIIRNSRNNGKYKVFSFII